MKTIIGNFNTSELNFNQSGLETPDFILKLLASSGSRAGVKEKL